MTQNTLCWHDFAGVRTDEDLNIIGEPLKIMAWPAPDSLPHPMSSLVTGINRVCPL